MVFHSYSFSINKDYKMCFKNFNELSISTQYIYLNFRLIEPKLNQLRSWGTTVKILGRVTERWQCPIHNGTIETFI